MNQEFQGFLVALSVCSGFGTPTLLQGAEYFHFSAIKEIRIQKSELCHLECGEGGKVSSGFWRKGPSFW